MCVVDISTPDRGARLIASRLLKWFDIGPTFNGAKSMTVDELAPLVRRMVENNWNEIAAGAHAIHKGDRGKGHNYLIDENGNKGWIIP
jgi:hypothetical protein